MIAINFIQQHGVDKAREVVEGAPDRATTVKPSLDFKHFIYGICENAGGAYILLSDLKRLVESVDQINALDGIDIAKKLLARINKHGSQYAELFERPALEQAIADYELLFCSGESK